MSSARFPFRIRTITAGVELQNLSDLASLTRARDFLKQARERFQEQGYQVQTLRIATQHLHRYLHGKSHAEATPYLREMDELLKPEGIMLSLGQLLPGDLHRPDLAEWAVELIGQTVATNFSVSVADRQQGVLPEAARTAAEIICAVARETPGGEGNFHFAAAANCPAGIPYFPAAFHEGSPAFGIGLESPGILLKLLAETLQPATADSLRQALEQALQPVENLAGQLADSHGWRFNGLDTSLAPGLDASIGEVVERLSGQPFGSAATLRACSLLTDVMKSVNVRRCGYSGLMLPVIEDKVLAKRAGEGRFTVKELLLYSAVSGTGLDVVPLPGDTSVQVVHHLLLDAAALSLKYTDKALSARLFLIPGKQAGEMVHFQNPYLTSCQVMGIW